MAKSRSKSSAGAAEAGGASRRSRPKNSGLPEFVRPRPPESVFDQFRAVFLPAPEVWEWVEQNILTEGGPLYNVHHAHLEHADVGILWTNTECKRKGRRIAGMAEQPAFMCHQWQKARQELQIRQWFGRIPDFMITLDAHYAAQCSDVEFCMLIEHEMYHCAQKRDEFGAPKFYQDSGMPQFEITGHDVEEFIGVVSRYGTGRPETPLSALVQAANLPPAIGKASIAAACGTCLLRAA